MNGVSADSKIWVKIKNQILNLTMSDLWEYAATHFTVETAKNVTDKEYINLKSPIFEIITYSERYENLITSIYPSYLIRSQQPKICNINNKIKISPLHCLVKFNGEILQKTFLSDAESYLKVNFIGDHKPIISNYVVENYNCIVENKITSKIFEKYNNWTYNLSLPYTHHFIINDILVYDSI